jgi:pimeloyl-ACP methyl ester carboxylesterase
MRVPTGPGLPPTALRVWGEEGAAPVLLLHGLPTGAWLWEGVGPRLAAQGWRAIAPDLPGYGGTGLLAGGAAGLGAHGRWLDALVEAMGIGRDLCLVGHDYGGLLAADRAARVGARSLCLSSTAADLAWAPVRASALPLLERYFYRRHGGRRWLRMGVEEEERAALFEACAEVLADPDLPARMRATAAGIPLRDVARLPGRLRGRVPILCLWGEADRSVPLGVARWTARRLGARLETTPGRHYACWARPEPFAAALLRHLGPAAPR